MGADHSELAAAARGVRAQRRGQGEACAGAVVAEPEEGTGRAGGLDCGPMSGFKNDMVDAAFFPDGRFKSNFLCCLGHGDPSTLPQQDYRFAFDETCAIL